MQSSFQSIDVNLDFLPSWPQSPLSYRAWRKTEKAGPDRVKNLKAYVTGVKGTAA